MTVAEVQKIRQQIKDNQDFMVICDNDKMQLSKSSIILFDDEQEIVYFISRANVNARRDDNIEIMMTPYEHIQNIYTLNTYEQFTEFYNTKLKSLLANNTMYTEEQILAKFKSRY